MSRPRIPRPPRSDPTGSGTRRGYPADLQALLETIAVQVPAPTPCQQMLWLALPAIAVQPRRVLVDRLTAAARRVQTRGTGPDAHLRRAVHAAVCAQCAALKALVEQRHGRPEESA